MMNDPILHLLGLARKAGKLEVGEEPVGAVCRARHARLLLLAADAAPNTCRRAAHFGEAGNVLWLQLPFPYTKEELGFQLGRKSCAMVAVTDFGLAAAVAGKLELMDPERYGPAALQVRTKADRALQRQKEKRQHEKNLREGRHKPWAAPAPASKPPRSADRDGASPGERPRHTKGRGVPAQKSAPSGMKKRPGDAPNRSPKSPGPGGRKLTAKPAPGGRRPTGMKPEESRWPSHDE